MYRTPFSNRINNAAVKEIERLQKKIDKEQDPYMRLKMMEMQAMSCNNPYDLGSMYSRYQQPW